MSDPSFRFKQFEVFHDRCAMKVGMDGVLLGAWANAPQEVSKKDIRILDIGTGSGLIALMLAQKYPDAIIDAVEKDVSASLQAAENVAHSPWPNAIEIHQGGFPEVMRGLEYPTEGAYHLIVSNPPYFRDNLKPVNKMRRMARHAEDLTFLNLVQGVAPLLHQDGLFSVIIPFDAAEVFEEYCWEYKLYPQKYCEVISVEGKAPKRMMLSFSKNNLAIEREHLTLSDKEGKETEEYKRLTGAYYLAF